jgi:DNA-directed RNA polymerase subunit RPC12/RpoP
VEEDELGLQHVIRHTEYVTCSRCGAVVPRSNVATVPGDALAGTSEYEYLCDNCWAALADGEQDLPDAEM